MEKFISKLLSALFTLVVVGIGIGFVAYGDKLPKIDPTPFQFAILLVVATYLYGFAKFLTFPLATFRKAATWPVVIWKNGREEWRQRRSS